MLSVNSPKKQTHALFWRFECVCLCVKGDTSNLGSEIDSCARSVEDVNGSKKDLSASPGEIHKCLQAAHIVAARVNDATIGIQNTELLGDFFKASIDKTCSVCVRTLPSLRRIVSLISVDCTLSGLSQ